MDILQQIRELQFTDKSRAEALLLSFLQEITPYEVVSVQLTPSAVSLNSFNGILSVTDGHRYFFKTHTESDTVIDEYYNAELLASAGYPVIQPVFQSTTQGKQILIYELVESPSLFDLAWSIEQTPDNTSLNRISRAQRTADEDLFKIYQKTYESQSAENTNKAPIHQLFYHRLTGGRLDRFYNAGRMRFPAGEYELVRIRNLQWEINGQRYDETLDQIIQRAVSSLKPSKLAGASIVGHGDAHNGNVFLLDDDTLCYFDPAFAGRHHPLIDIVKPIFHNVFAMWMYYPEVIADRLEITATLDDNSDTMNVHYRYDLSPVRQIFLTSKVELVLQPTVKWLKDNSLLPENWREIVKCALFCCPFLTMDLTDQTKFPPEIALLGIVMSVEMGSESRGTKSTIDHLLDGIESSIS